MREFESDAGGEPLSDRVAKGVNDIWRKPKDSDAYKNAAKRAKKPTNTQLNHLHLNDELLGLVSAGSKTFDGRLKSLQLMLCKAAVPTARLLDKIVSGKMNLEKEEQKLAERELVDTISLIAHTNNTVNYQRRDAIKRRLPPHYSLALKAPEIPGDTLFGDECSEKLRKAGYGSKIQKDVRQYQQYQRENWGGQYRPQRSRGRGADRGNRTRPYPQRGGRGAPFLGENSPIEIVKSQSFALHVTHVSGFYLHVSDVSRLYLRMSYDRLYLNVLFSMSVDSVYTFLMSAGSIYACLMTGSI